MLSESLKTQTDLSDDEFNQLLEQETDIKLYKKLNFLKLVKEGYSIKEAYKLANIKKSLAYLTLDQWNERGYEGLIRKKRRWKKSKIK